MTRTKIGALVLAVITSSGFAPWPGSRHLLADGKIKTRDADRAVKDGLAIQLNLPKKEFTPEAALAFKITLENVTKKPFLIERGPDTFDACCVLLVKNVATGETYQGTAEWLSRVRLRSGEGCPLKPGVPLVYERDSKLGKWQFVLQGAARQEARESLPEGKYRLEVRVRLDKPGQETPDRLSVWVGEITTKPVEIQVVKDGAKNK